MQETITKVIKVADKAERLSLQPKGGHMAVQKDVHERYFFDGYRWRLWKPGTSRHWLPSGKPQARKVTGRQGEEATRQPEPTIKKKKTNPYLIAGVIALAITIILLINII